MESTRQNNPFDVSEIELTYKTKISAKERPKITSSTDALNILRNSWSDESIELFEEFKILLLNRANRVLGVVEISKGGMTATTADPKMIFGAALKAAACGIILSHNHPSGSLTFSQADIDLTSKCKMGGKLLEIQVLDHIILTRDGYVSAADEGLL